MSEPTSPSSGWEHVRAVKFLGLAEPVYWKSEVDAARAADASQIAAQQKQIDRLEVNHRIEVGQWSAQVAALSAQVEHFQQGIADERARCQDTYAAQAKEVARLRARVEQLTQEKAESRKWRTLRENMELKKEVASLRQQLDALQQHIERLTQENTALREALGWMISLHDNPCPYDAATTITVARQRLQQLRQQLTEKEKA